MPHDWILALQAPGEPRGLSSLGLRRRAIAALGRGPVDWGIAASRNMAEYILKSVPEWPGSRSEEETEALQRAVEASLLDTVMALHTGDLSLLCDSLEPVENVAFFVQNEIPLGEVMRNVHAGEEFTTRSLLSEIELHVSEGERLPAVKAMMSDVVTAWSLFARHVSLTYEREAERWARSKDALRMRIVEEIVEGSNRPPANASRDLGYALEQPHLALTLTLPTMAIETARAFDFASVSASIARACGSPHRPLVVRRGAARCDVWIGSPRVPSPAESIAGAPWPSGLRIAVSRVHPGAEGFRLGRLEARAASRMTQFVPTHHPVTDYADVELVSLLSMDLERARGFVSHTLGPLAEDDPRSSELRETLATYIDTGGVIADTAQRLYVHRNTISYRLQQIEKSIGRSYDLAATRTAIELVRRVPQLMQRAKAG